MPSYRVYICDKCSRRADYEGADYLRPGWCEVNVMHGFSENEHEDAEPPDEQHWILCGECSPAVLSGLGALVSGRTGAH